MAPAAGRAHVTVTSGCCSKLGKETGRRRVCFVVFQSPPQFVHRNTLLVYYTRLKQGGELEESLLLPDLSRPTPARHSFGDVIWEEKRPGQF